MIEIFSINNTKETDNLIWDEELELEQENENIYRISPFKHDMLRNDSEKFGFISDISNFEQKQRSEEKSDLRDEFDDFIRLGSKFDWISNKDFENELEVFNFQQRFDYKQRNNKIQESSHKEESAFQDWDIDESYDSNIKVRFE